MIFKYICICLFYTLIFANQNQQFVEKEGHFEIQESQLFDYLQNNQRALVYFRNSNNNRLDQNDKEFVLTIQNKKSDHDFTICKVNTENEELPEFRLYSSGFYRDFDFQPQFRRILSWAKLNFQRQPKVQKLTQSQLNLAKKLQSYLVFKYPKDDKNFELLIQEFSKIKIGTKIYYTEEDFDLNLQGKSYEMVIGRNFEDGNKVFSQDAPFQASFIQELFELHSRPHVQIYNEQHQQNLFSGKKIILYFDNVTSEKERKYKEMSFKYSNKAVFYLTDMSNEASTQFGRFLGVTKDDFPAVRALQFKIKQRQWTKYKPDQQQDIEEFIQLFIKDKKQEYFKEEPVLEHEKNYQFKKIVRGNFDEVVNDSSKHVLIAFVTDWCEHCKEIKPAFNEIKTLIKDEVKDIVFGIINVDKNDIELSFKNFPTIYLYKKGQKDKPINYDGMRDAEVILNFVETQIADDRAIYNRKMPAELKQQQEEMEQKMKEQQNNTEDEYDL